MTTYGPGNPPPEFDDIDPELKDLARRMIADEIANDPEAFLADQLDLDLLLWGNTYVVDGKRVDPTTVVVHRRTPQGQAEQVHPPIHTQEEFLTALDVLLDHTLHADECYIDDAQTECVCAIGKVRAVLPPCGAVQPPPSGEGHLYRCTRNAHPSSPDRHTFG